MNHIFQVPKPSLSFKVRPQKLSWYPGSLY